jgi:L-cysteate sulfo-lyase
MAAHPDFPAVNIARFPTPFHELQRLNRRLGGARIWIKRDDMTGLAMGGSKARSLATLLGEASRLNADTIVTCGPVSSNHVRLTAAAANSQGMGAVLVLQPRKPNSDLQGNMLLNHILGARIVYANDDSPAALEAKVAEAASELRLAGARPYVIPGGGFSPLGAIGYIELVRELYEQARDEGIAIDAIVFASGSGCIQSGLHLGSLYYEKSATKSATNKSATILGVTINRPVAELRDRIETDVAKAAAMIRLEKQPGADELHILSGYLGEGYSVPTSKGMAAIDLLARMEGILLDPCYTGKAMAAAIDVATREFHRGQNVVFIHTGGLPGIFNYPSEAYHASSGPHE